jgi:hypothetical protein
MAEITFPCPSCHKGIQCDDSYCGQMIQCPMCHAEFRVPQKESLPKQNPLVPQPTSGGSKLSAGSTQVARSSSGTGVPQKPVTKGPKKKQSKLMAYVPLFVALAVIGGGLYFGIPFYKKWKEDRENKAIAEAEAAALANAPAPEPEPVVTNAPVLPPVHTLDIAAAKIPEGKVNGSISGTNFLAETIRIDRSGYAQILNVRQGAGLSPDRGVLVYMRLNPGEIPTNKTFTVSAAEKPTGISQVRKLWKTNPKYAAQQKNYFTGYALKLEFGSQAEDGSIPGRIFLALPDPEKTVVAGVFTVNTTPAVPGMEAVPQEVTSPQDAASRANFNQRYGITR